MSAVKAEKIVGEEYKKYRQDQDYSFMSHFDREIKKIEKKFKRSNRNTTT